MAVNSVTFLLLAGSGSGTAEEAVALRLIEPGFFGAFAVTVTIVDAPGARFPTLQLIAFALPLLTVQVGEPGITDTSEPPVTVVLERLTCVAAAGPLLVTFAA